MKTIVRRVASRGATEGTIEDHTNGMTTMVPYFVRNCIKEVEKRGMKEEGLYMTNGNLKTIKILLKLRFKNNVDLSDFDIHDIIGALKTYLRTLYGRVINKHDGQSLLFYNELPSAIKELKLKNLISQKLKQPNRDTLAFLILHLQKVIETPENKLKSSHLASIFGQTLFSNVNLKDKRISIISPKRIKAKVVFQDVQVSRSYSDG
uniref:GAP3 n=1 Tax=Leptopilina boulardi TaxID=63433 RepID=A0A8G1M451_9HYME|nr:EsGAP3 [Leptopilina boulardi]